MEPDVIHGVARVGKNDDADFAPRVEADEGKVRKPAVPPLCQTMAVSPTDWTIQFSPIDI